MIALDTVGMGVNRYTGVNWSTTTISSNLQIMQNTVYWSKGQPMDRFQDTFYSVMS